MDKRDAEFMKKILATFRVEAREHLQAITAGLLELEKGAAGQQAQFVENIFREAHSLKGAARAVNHAEMERACHAAESVLASLKRGEIALSPTLLDALHAVVDTLGKLIPLSGGEPSRAEKVGVTEVIQQLERAAKGDLAMQVESAQPRAEEESPAPAAPLVEEKTALTETVRISTARLTALLLQTEELISAKLAASQHAAELRELGAMLRLWRKEWAKAGISDLGLRRRVPPGRIADFSLQGEGFLEWNETFYRSLEHRVNMLTKAGEQDRRALGKMVDDLLADIKQALMFPFASLLEIFPKVARDLAREQGKEVELVVRGGEIEIDRRILEELKDPLLHLVRNCIDHGIERPEERLRKNKAPRGRVTIAVAQKDNSQVEVLVADDGAGIDAAKVKAAAVKSGVVSLQEAEQLDAAEARALIFQTGISTSPIVTDLSGRGLGLAIVQEKADRLGGAVAVESQPGVGTTFRLLLPLTLATFRGVIVRLDDHPFVVPATNVERVARVDRAQIKTVENRETIELNGQAVALVWLKSVLGLDARAANEEGVKVPYLALVWAQKRIAFAVDEILGEQEVLVKGLGPQLARVRNVAGATVLGNGRVAPILNVPDLFKSALRAGDVVRWSSGQMVSRPRDHATTRKPILVAEDSITARALLKNILEAAGYQVATAVDGVDALTQLRAGEFELLVSDVDMPRLSGLDLTARVRADKKLAELPVVLVTALDSRQDRERGIEVGANAYIVKSSFDQSNLLEVIKRLV